MSSKRLGQDTVLERFRTSGAMKTLFTRGTSELNAIMINTSGGLTSGDQFAVDITAGPGGEVVLTTQAAERAYRANAGPARVKSRIEVAPDANVSWLPQELIVYDGAALARRLSVELAQNARFLMVEPVIFGRRAMGERVKSIRLDDRIEIRRKSRPLYSDRVRIDGNAEKVLSLSAVCRAARAMASVVFVNPNAEARLDQVRASLPPTGGASLLAPDMLVARILAKDGFELRRSLIPILECLKGTALPRPWSL
ncbi:MAG: urease accessory protein UreD [Pseudomonadota bacterium]